MRASPRRRSAEAGGAGRALRVTACLTAASLAAWAAWAWAVPAGSPVVGTSVAGRAVAAAKQAAAKADARTRALDATVKSMAPAKAGATKPVVTAKAVPPGRAVPPAVAKATAPGAPSAVKPATPAVAKAAATRAPQVAGPRPQVAAMAASMHPAMNPVPAPSPAAAHLDDQVTYQYNALGRRDPFMPLVGGAEYVAVDAPPDVGGIKVVGIVWGAEDKFAIIEDGRGNSAVLRPGDKVMNGIVEGLKRDGLIVNITVDGQSQSVTIPLTRKGDSNANR